MSTKNKTTDMDKNNSAFTIVELLVVIVVIGILAAITIVSYSGIATRAKIASIRSDLVSSSKLLKMFYVDYGYYPNTISVDCISSPNSSTNLCLRPSSGNSFTDTPYIRPNDQSFVLTSTNGSLKYHITESSEVIVGAYIDPNYVVIGSQTWSRKNLNVGTMINSATAQTNNSVIEKYCYANLESNCDQFGGLYQWNEAMQYVGTSGAQGICPSGSHLPSDGEWKTLELQLGMTQAQVDLNASWRGVDQGTQLKVGGSSMMDIKMSGYKDTVSGFAYPDGAVFWSSTDSGAGGRTRNLQNDLNTVGRFVNSYLYGFSIRCVLN